MSHSNSDQPDHTQRSHSTRGRDAEENEVWNSRQSGVDLATARSKSGRGTQQSERNTRESERYDGEKRDQSVNVGFVGERVSVQMDFGSQPTQDVAVICASSDQHVAEIHVPREVYVRAKVSMHAVLRMYSDKSLHAGICNIYM
ncbi:hypothetical protein SARC_17445 [Sphaeroforma arctica JP610]|uniref:Uncharacterized protein n=1 Tax=Sphaeroforma arctica JP610 TaxID=667725 RepID=A0A0L0F1K5_9EUKA|nr:hypothetical protein SARC_17445 [Sphaeroforma arctica JP610]KNC70033.1 hypothetical protein SARC_17445 [Sphaeroforma arctica JP610]|eukprot:XP_014143935.1 hypothetical protein SARC_17445 [Sphaeroforma arctica JP610]